MDPRFYRVWSAMHDKGPPVAELANAYSTWWSRLGLEADRSVLKSSVVPDP
jgi:hypothetical protein